jgi:hypothetical protein
MLHLETASHSQSTLSPTAAPPTPGDPASISPSRSDADGWADEGLQDAEPPITPPAPPPASPPKGGDEGSEEDSWGDEGFQDAQLPITHPELPPGSPPKRDNGGSGEDGLVNEGFRNAQHLIAPPPSPPPGSSPEVGDEGLQGDGWGDEGFQTAETPDPPFLPPTAHVAKEGNADPEEDDRNDEEFHAAEPSDLGGERNRVYPPEPRGTPQAPPPAENGDEWGRHSSVSIQEAAESGEEAAPAGRGTEDAVDDEIYTGEEISVEARGGAKDGFSGAAGEGAGAGDDNDSWGDDFRNASLLSPPSAPQEESSVPLNTLDPENPPQQAGLHATLEPETKYESSSSQSGPVQTGGDAEKADHREVPPQRDPETSSPRECIDDSPRGTEREEAETSRVPGEPGSFLEAAHPSGGIGKVASEGTAEVGTGLRKGGPGVPESSSPPDRGGDFGSKKHSEGDASRSDSLEVADAAADALENSAAGGGGDDEWGDGDWGDDDFQVRSRG